MHMHECNANTISIRPRGFCAIRRRAFIKCTTARIQLIVNHATSVVISTCCMCACVSVRFRRVRQMHHCDRFSDWHPNGRLNGLHADIMWCKRIYRVALVDFIPKDIIMLFSALRPRFSTMKSEINKNTQSHAQLVVQYITRGSISGWYVTLLALFLIQTFHFP